MRLNKILSIITFILLIHVAGAQTSSDWYNIGFAFSESGEYNKAIEAYDKAINIDPNNAFAWNSKGYALAKLGENRRALEAYDKAIAINPNDEEAWLNKGVAHLFLGEYSKSIEASSRGGTYGWIRVFVTISIGILFVAFVIPVYRLFQ